MFLRLESMIRGMRRRFGRTGLAIRLLGLETPPPPETEPEARGLVLIQIDGLAHHQLARALEAGRMPHLKRMLERDDHRLLEFFSGVPSTTPAVQGELFYGVRTAVPAFAFVERGTGRLHRMFWGESARRVEARLAETGEEPLLAGGMSLSNIYAAGSREAWFCAAGLTFGTAMRSIGRVSLLGVMLTYGWSAVRVACLMVAELVIALHDFARGAIAGEDLGRELRFVPARVIVCIMGRELVTVAARLGVARGLPIVHANFLGYDEQAHRRGPSSLFAHWSLRGIDSAIAAIHRAAAVGPRDYDVWIYSDHGQTHVDPYPKLHGRDVHEAVAEVFEAFEARASEAGGATRPPRPVRGAGERRADRAGEALGRRSYVRLFQRGEELDEATQRRLEDERDAARGEGPRALQVVAQGPVGHVYPGRELAPEELAAIAPELVGRAAVPLVLAPDGPGRVAAWNARGRFALPDDGAEVFGATHPFLAAVVEDVIRLVHHRDAGALVISGFRPEGEGRCVSFPVENGAHAGPSPEETRGFALLPRDAPVRMEAGTYLRPGDLRRAVRIATGREAPPAREPGVPGGFHLVTRLPREARSLRLLTYNVHSCIGMDGRLSVDRIARVILQCDPDVVALQELDRSRPRTAMLDQAHEIARRLEMDFHFHPALMLEEELYGDAVLSRLPMRLLRADGLPTLPGRGLEPRGALMVAIDVGGVEVRLVNAHLGLRHAERMRQVEALLGPEWLGAPAEEREGGPPERAAILCGDLNALPGMGPCRKIRRTMFDAVETAPEPDGRTRRGPRPSRWTFPTNAPMGRIDHVFVRGAIESRAARVVRTSLARMASDHLPLLVDLRTTDEVPRRERSRAAARAVPPYMR